jgi:hypothetical protein
MNTDRIKEIQKETAYPDSVSVQQALLKVWNECKQEKAVNKNDLLPDVSNRRELLIAFCDWYKITDFNCEGHSEVMCVDEYLKRNL